MRNLFRVLVIGDAGLLRDGLCCLLDVEDYAETVGAIDDVAAVDQLSLRHNPHLVVLDIATPDRNWETAVADIKNRWPSVRVIALTDAKEPAVPADSKPSNADVRFPKTHRGSKLIDTMRGVLEGEPHRTDPRSPQLPDHTLARPSALHQQTADVLSDREREVMKQIGRGLRTREIALQLSVSQKTIEKHRSNLMRKLGLRTATAVAAYAIAKGYVEPT
jgi:DNA-binding NarL/FixJ family response regulator